MWRMIFLILVVLGALAVVLAAILGLGVARVAMVQSADSSVATTAPSTQPAPATQAVAALPADADAAVEPKGLRPEGAPRVDPVPVAVRPAPQKPAEFVPGTIVLRAGSAKLGGKLLRKAPPEWDLTNWTRPEDYASWVFSPPPGKYNVFLTHATEAAGEYALVMGESKKTEPAFVTKVAATGGGNAFRTEFMGALELEEKRTTLVIRSTAELPVAQMRLRQIELVPAEPLAAPAGDDVAMEILGLTLVEAATGKPLGLLTNVMVLDLASMPPFSIRAETAGPVKSVKFAIDKKELHTESERPFSIAGDEQGRTYTPWTPEPGRYTLVVTPYSEQGGGGKAGSKRSFYLRLASFSPILLTPRDAKLNGETIRRLNDEPPAIVSWLRRQDWVEWTTVIPGAGEYAVEITYACEKDQGGEFVLRIGDERLTEDTESTGGWGTYERRNIGRVKLKKGKATVAIKPSELNDGKALMNLREVRLVPVVESDD